MNYCVGPDLPLGAFQVEAGRMRLYKKDSDPPDYEPMAQASEEAARIGAELGREQLAEAQRQFDIGTEFLQPILEAQTRILQDASEQGRDFADYEKTFRPLEQQMRDSAFEGTEDANAAERAAIAERALADAQKLTDRTDAFRAQQDADLAMVSGGNQGVVDRFGADIDQDVGQAVADARQGQTAALNTAMRQAMRYGMSVPPNVSDQTNLNALMQAGAANAARSNAIDNYRNIVAQSLGLQQQSFATGQAADMDAMNMRQRADSADRNMRIQDQGLDWARQLDVAGIARGLPGASQGAYSVAINAGNSAAANQAQPGQSLVNAMGQANATQMQGQGQRIQGLGSILSSQTSVYNADQSDPFGDILGLAGLGVKLYQSDRRLKQDIEPVGRDEATGLTLYEFSFRDDPQRRYIGVMADEVQQVAPDAVTEINGYMAVDYGALGLEMVEVNHAT